MPSNWTKGPLYINARRLNDTDDPVLQGAIQSLPSGVTGVNQGIQDLPGDRLILSTADALALSDTTIGTLFSGMYQYVRTTSTSTAANARGRLAFWNTALETTGNPYIVTPDETQAQGVAMLNGVFLNTIVKGDWGWVQILGKASIQSRAVFTGIAAQGVGAYAAGAGAGADVGSFDVFNGDAANPTFDQVDKMIVRYLGVTEALPVAGTITTVDLTPRWYRL
jgi:hypothetical protein